MLTAFITFRNLRYLMFRVHTFYEQEKIDTEMQCTVFCYKQFCGYKVIEVVALICFCTRFAKSACRLFRIAENVVGKVANTVMFFPNIDYKCVLKFRLIRPIGIDSCMQSVLHAI